MSGGVDIKQFSTVVDTVVIDGQPVPIDRPFEATIIRCDVKADGEVVEIVQHAFMDRYQAALALQRVIRTAEEGQREARRDGKA